MPKVALVIELLGFENCGVFVRLKASPRRSTFTPPRSPKANCRAILPFNPKVPGPVMMLRPVVPNRTPTGCAKLLVSNQGLPRLIPCRILIGATKSAVCVLLGRFKLLLAVRSEERRVGNERGAWCGPEEW